MKIIATTVITMAPIPTAIPIVIAKKIGFQPAGVSDNDQHENTSRIPPKPPKFRRRSAIRDFFDLACSIYEFVHDSIASKHTIVS